MRIDAHQHFWRYSAAEYPWIGAGMEVLGRDYLPADLRPHLERAGLDASIAVQARSSEEETRFLLELARGEPRIAAVVGWLDLAGPDLDDALERFAGEEKLKGLRHVVQDEPDDEFLLRPDFGRGVALVGERGLVYDVLVYARHLPVVRRFLERHPDQDFVLDHLGKPVVAEGARGAFAALLRAIAAHPRTACKLSGLVTEARWNAWTADELTPFLDAAYEAFGAERVLFGSDWPVCRLAGEYDAVHGLVARWAERLGPAERALLFGGNAARWYRLTPGSARA